MSVSKFQPSFAAGELCPELKRRIDLQKYAVGADTIKNMVVLPRGGVQSRPGTKYIGETKTSTKQSRLVEFVFSTEQAYVLEFGDEYIRFFKDGGQIVSGESAYEIVSPYVVDDIWGLKFEQSADTLYIVHPDYQPRKLTRTGHTSWTLSTINFNPGPQMSENSDITKTLTLTGKVQLSRPTADLAVGGWTSTGANLYSVIDEETPSDSDYIASDLTTAKIQLGTVNTPATKSGHTLRIRAFMTAAIGLHIALHCGATEVYATQMADDKSKTRTYEINIPEYYVNKITDYSDLQLWLTGINGVGIAVYWAEFQCPLPESGTGGTTKSDIFLFSGDAVNIVSSENLFDAKHIGSVWSIRYISNAKSHYYCTPTTGECRSFPFLANGDWTINMDVGSLGINEVNMSIEKSVDNGTTWFKKKIIPATSDTSTVEYTGSEDAECWMRIVRDEAPSTTDNAAFTISTQGRESYCYFRITAVTDAKNATAVLLSGLTMPGVAFANWSEAAWSSYRGWPNSVSFFHNCLFFGGTQSFPNTYWKSKVDDYENFSISIPQVADDAIADRLPARQVNAIEWFVPVQALITLTADSEWSISPGSNGVLSYDSKLTKQQTYFGANSQVEPVVMGDVVVFLQRNGGKVRSLGYSYEIDGYTGNDLSIMADHLFNGYTIVDWAYQQTPNSILWAVRSDGKLLSFTFHKEHDVWAWAQHDTDGLFESVASIPGVGQDDVYFVVKRTINGSTKRYVEMLSHRVVTDHKSFYGVDCGATYSGAATTTITGLSFLEGENVVVLADGIENIGKTVVSGQITIDKASTLVHVGLNYEWELKTLQIDLNSSSDRKKITNGITLSVINSKGGEASTDSDTFAPIQYPQVELYTGDLTENILMSGWDYDGQVTLKGDGLYPMQIIGITPQVTLGGK